MSAVSPDLPRLLLAPMEGLLDARLRAVVTQAARYDWCVTEFIRVTGTVLPARCYTRVAPELLNASRTVALYSQPMSTFITTPSSHPHRPDPSTRCPPRTP